MRNFVRVCLVLLALSAPSMAAAESQGILVPVGADGKWVLTAEQDEALSQFVAEARENGEQVVVVMGSANPVAEEKLVEKIGTENAVVPFLEPNPLVSAPPPPADDDPEKGFALSIGVGPGLGLHRISAKDMVPQRDDTLNGEAFGNPIPWFEFVTRIKAAIYDPGLEIGLVLKWQFRGPASFNDGGKFRLTELIVQPKIAQLSPNKNKPDAKLDAKLNGNIGFVRWQSREELPIFDPTTQKEGKASFQANAQGLAAGLELDLGPKPRGKSGFSPRFIFGANLNVLNRTYDINDDFSEPRPPIKGKTFVTGQAYVTVLLDFRFLNFGK
jgi:hypothetical protein